MLTRLSTVLLIVMVFLITSCTLKQENENSIQSQLKQMTQDLAMDSEVQRAFLKGRKEKVESDGPLRREIFTQNIREQRGMLEEPAIATQMLDLNTDVTKRALMNPNTQDRYLKINLQTMQKIASAPTKRNQLLQTLQRSRQDALQDRKMRSLLLKQGVQEHYDALNTPGITPMVLNYNMDVLERVSTHPNQKKRLMKSQIKTLKAIAKDPQLRPELIALMIELMKDPAMKNEMLQMMQQQMEQQMKRMQQQIEKEKTQMQSKPNQPNGTSGGFENTSVQRAGASMNGQ